MQPCAAKTSFMLSAVIKWRENIPCGFYQTQYLHWEDPLRALQKCETVPAAWLKLNERYAGKPAINKFSAFSNLIDTKCDQGTEMADHHAQLQSQFFRLPCISIIVKESKCVFLLLPSLNGCERYVPLLVSAITADKTDATC